MKTSVLYAGVSLFVAASVPAISPPQYSLQRQLESSFGADPCVTVSEVYEQGDGWMIDVQGCDVEINSGLAFVLKKDYDFGGIRVTVRVLDSDGNPVVDDAPLVPDDPGETVREFFHKALRDNPYFAQFPGQDGGSVIPFVWIEIETEVIQYWNDNIGDFYGNDNRVAASVFQEVCNLDFFGSVTVQFTTAVKKTDAAVKFYEDLR